MSILNKKTAIEVCINLSGKPRHNPVISSAFGTIRLDEMIIRSAQRIRYLAGQPDHTRNATWVSVAGNGLVGSTITIRAAVLGHGFGACASLVERALSACCRAFSDIGPIAPVAITGAWLYVAGNGLVGSTITIRAAILGRGVGACASLVEAALAACCRAFSDVGPIAPVTVN